MTRRIEDHYRTLLRDHGDSAEAAQYSSRESQYRRFAALAPIADLSGRQILDFGCGTASLHDYLVGIGQPPAHYTGVDVVTEFFDIARQKVPGGVFCHPDALGDAEFDYAFVSGVFNNRRKGNRAFWQETVQSLFARCRGGVAFNMMSTYVDFQDPGLFYEQPERAFGFVKRAVTPYVVLRHDYLPKPGSVAFEFAIYAYRNPPELTA
ncbi:MAG: Methyltransferase domain [Rhodobacteraceae bacterium HLUCCA12]|nr:MAG: Methyltransferase domain [Rhodobacteraceae bacterium HLUCCA12]